MTTRDLAYLVLNTTGQPAYLADLYADWMETNSLSAGDLGSFFSTQMGISNVADAEYAYWESLVPT